MRLNSVFVRCAAFFVAVCGLASLSASAQTLRAAVGSVVPALHVADAGLAGPAGPSHRRRTEDRLIYARIREGVYTVDGMVAKVHLNYDVEGAPYLYLFVPGVGTAVISATPDQDAVMAPAALRQDELHFNVDHHHFTLTGVNLVSDKGQAPTHLYVRLDRAAWGLSRMPMVGFGTLAEFPYEWPGALPTEQREESEALPPVPSSLLPRMLPRLSTAVPAAQSSRAALPATPAPVALR